MLIIPIARRLEQEDCHELGNEAGFQSKSQVSIYKTPTKSMFEPKVNLYCPNFKANALHMG